MVVLGVIGEPTNCAEIAFGLISVCCFCVVCDFSWNLLYTCFGFSIGSNLGRGGPSIFGGLSNSVGGIGDLVTDCGRLLQFKTGWIGL